MRQREYCRAIENRPKLLLSEIKTFLFFSSSSAHNAVKSSPSSASRNKKDLEINRKNLNVNEILGYLHPEDSKSKQ